MARGGGTGSRTKQKKKSETTTTQNGAADTELKQNKTTKHRKQKDETPPTNHIEEEPSVKEEKGPNKLVPTSEQLRLAMVTQDTTLDPIRKGKITKVMDFTDKSEDEVATALFDCGWDEQRAIELLLEEGGDLGSWEETGKKKKKKQDKEDKDGKENEDWDTDNFDPRQDGDNRDKSRGRGPPRFKRGGSSAPGGGRQDDLWKNKEWQENEKNFEGGRGRGGGRGARGSRGGMGMRQRGRGAGPRQFGPGGGDAGRIGGGPVVPDSGPFGQIDTWNPVPEENANSVRRGKMSNRDAFDNAGNWGDDFPTAEDWDNDEYTGSLSDTKVFTPSGTTGKSAVGEPVNPNTVGSAAVGVAAAQHSPANNSLSGASYGQQIDLSSLLPKPGVAPGGPSAAPGGPTVSSLGTSLSQYNQTATQDLKTAIGIGGPSSGSKSGELAPGYGSSALSYSSGGSSQFSTSSGNTNFGSAAPGSAFSPIKPAAVTNGTSGSKALPRARLPPPSKIPSSAVEMPGDTLSTLDVQFGGLDLQFGANSESSATSAGSGFDFTGGSSLSSNKDLDSKYSIPVTSADKTLDNYSKSGPATVKDVNQSLNNALTAAGIKTSGVNPETVGYPTNQRTDKTNSNFAPQRSPGPQSLDRSKPPAVTDSLGGYSSSGYYQNSSQSKPSNQFGHQPNAYQSNSYDRQSSSGYSNSNGLSSSYGSGSGSSYNTAAPSNNSYSSSSGNASSSLSNSSSSNYNHPYVSTSSYSSYNNSYSSKPSTNNSSYTTTAHSQFPAASEAPTTTSAKFDSSVTGSGYPTNNFGLTSSVSSKMSVNSTGSSKMMPNIPPGVASMIPQYMIGAGAGAGFPTYLAAGLQQPMYGYGGVGAGPQLGGVSGHQLEDLAALQRSTLASLPQLVGSGNQQTNTKGPSTAGYYDPSSQFGTASSISTTRTDANSFTDTSKFGVTGSGVTDSTSSPVPSTVAATGQPTPFNALANTFAAAAPTQHPTLPPGYAYFYGGMAPQLQAAYGQTGVYPTAHPGIVPTAAGGTSTTQFQKQGYGSSTDYGKSNFASQGGQGKGSNSSNTGHWFGGGGNLW